MFVTSTEATFAWACAGCGAGSLHRSGTSSFQCQVCKGTTEFRACPRCGEGLSVSPTVRAIKKAELQCSACGAEASRKKFRSIGIERVHIPAGFVGAYADMGLSYQECSAFSGRRSIHGMLVGSSGLNVGAGGSGGVSLYFEKNVLVACIGTMANAGCIPMDDLTEVTVGSRADFVGRDADSIDRSTVSGMLASSAVVALRYRAPQATETIVTVVWDDGGIVLLNQTVPSAVAVERFAPVLERAFRARGTASESIVDQMARLALFHDAGMMSQDEFDSATAHTLGHDRRS